MSSSISPSTDVSSPIRAMRKLDPMRAHGAWIYLCTSVAAGALVGANYGVEPAMLVGTSFAGAFLAIAGFSVGVRQRWRQAAAGVGMAVLAALGALALRAESEFLWVALLATVIAVAVVFLARTFGYLSHATMIAGVAVLTLAAPAAAIAGGATPLRAACLFGLLWVVYCWRTLLVAAAYLEGQAVSKKELRARGLREAAIAAVWSLAVAVTLRIF